MFHLDWVLSTDRHIYSIDYAAAAVTFSQMMFWRAGKADIKSGTRGGTPLNPSVERIRAPGGPDECWAERQHPSFGGAKPA